MDLAVLLKRMVVGIVGVVLMVAALSVMGMLVLVLIIAGTVALLVLRWKARKSGWQGAEHLWMRNLAVDAMARRMRTPNPNRPTDAGAIEGEYVQLDAHELDGDKNTKN